jgi:hypothetical protein
MDNCLHPVGGALRQRHLVVMCTIRRGSPGNAVLKIAEGEEKT